jgi:hypothetical protein
MKKIYLLLSFLFTIFLLQNGFAQDDLMKMLDDASPAENTKVFATFKDTKIINAQTTETVKKRTLAFCISHRFSNVNTGIHGFYGFDSADNIRFSFDYGITNKLMIGVGRSKMRELLDGSVKFRFLEQSDKFPVSIALYGCMGFTPKKTTYEQWERSIDRLNYCSQLIIARKFGSRLSLELLPTYIHRNYITLLTNSYNGAENKNDLFAIGVGGRVKITKRSAIIFDFFQHLSAYKYKNPDRYYAPLSIGYEIETGGHVFHINFTNSSYIVENEFIYYSEDNWLDGGFKMGFNISRVFNLGGKK